MAQTTFSADNTGKPAPKWFRKLKKALTILSDTAVVMLLSMGHAENSFIMLWCRVGLSGILESCEAMLANGEVYAAAIDKPVIIINVDALPTTGEYGVWYFDGTNYFFWNGSSFTSVGGDRPTKPPVNP